MTPPRLGITPLVLSVACQGASLPVLPPPPLAPTPPSAPTSSPSPAPPPVAAPSNPAPLEVAIGTAGPVSFEAAAPDGTWVVFCQARSDDDKNGSVHVSVGPRGELGGDGLQRYLAASSGAELPIDELLTTSDSGQELLVSRGGQLFLHAPSRALDLPLTLPGADLRREPFVRSGHRTLALTESALFYVRTAGGGAELVSREHGSQQERVEYASSAPIVRFELHDSARIVVIRVPGADSNGNGRFDWPFVPRADALPCEGPIQRFRAPRPAADALSAVVLNRATGAAVRADDLVMPFGDALLRRGGDRTLVLEREGKTRVLADATCAGRVLFADPARQQLVLGCEAPKKPGRLLVDLVHGFTRTPLDIDVAALAFDEPIAPKRRLTALYPGADTVLLDLDQRTLHRLRPGDAVVNASGSRALVRRGRDLLWFDADAAREADLPGRIDPFGGLLVQGDLAYVSPFVVDTRAGAVLGAVTGPGLALASSGAVLVPSSAPSPDALALGPLRWVPPQSTER